MSSNPYARAIPLQRAIAEKHVEEYMIKNKLSLEKLRKQRFEIVIDTMIFAQPTGIEPDGLCNDIATRPYPTLVLRLGEQGNVQIETTEYTRKYLAE